MNRHSPVTGRKLVRCIALLSIGMMLGSPQTARARQVEGLNRIIVSSTEDNTPPLMPVPGQPPAFKDSGHAHMLSLGFSAADVDGLRTECKNYFNDYYGIDFNGGLNLPDGTIVGLGTAAGAVMIGERTPAGDASRVIIDTDYNSKKTFVVEDTGCAMLITVGGGTYNGINSGMPRTAGDVMVYGYANLFHPKNPITVPYLLERIKLKPAWPGQVVPVANVPGSTPRPPSIELVTKVEAEYIDSRGIVHYGHGIFAFSERYDQNGVYYRSIRNVYTFPQ